jgi:hypothetical protein
VTIAQVFKWYIGDNLAKYYHLLKDPRSESTVDAVDDAPPCLEGVVDDRIDLAADRGGVCLIRPLSMDAGVLMFPSLVGVVIS